MDNRRLALIVGNSDGIGLGLTKRLLDLGWQVHGLSRSPSQVEYDSYNHTTVDVTGGDFPAAVAEAAQGSPDLCVYCAGIGEALDFDNLAMEREVFEVNLMGAVKTIESVLPPMIKCGGGQIIVLSSLADEILSPEAPSYSASKAGLSSYVESLALAVREKGVAITNVRFGFVDTKMAKGDQKPFMMTVDRAVDYLIRCIEKRPIRFSRPRIMATLVRLARWAERLKMQML